MTAPPQLITRTLTFNFAPSASSSGGLPNVVEIALLPLDNAANTTAGATYAGGLQRTTVELVAPGPCTATFDLVPSYSPGLTAPILYRVMWRTGVMGRTYTFDFAMPDNNTTWDDLQAGVGNIIDGQSYLQQIDLGVAGGAARLNSDGDVIDAAGNPVVSQAELLALSDALLVETNERRGADNVLRATLESEMAIQADTLQTAAEHYTDTQLSPLTENLQAEAFNREVADDVLQNQIDTNRDNTQLNITALSQNVADNAVALISKANLDSFGKIFPEEVPDILRTTAHLVADQSAMLSLTYPTCHQGNLAIRPDGVWLLENDDPSLLGNWVSLTTVSSVNGQRGTVSLGAGDLVPAAIPVGGSVDFSQVTGLSTALSAKAAAADVTMLNDQVAGILGDVTLVHTEDGVIPYTLLDSNMVYLNENGKLVQKDGTIIPVGTGTGTGAVFSVNAKTGAVVLTAADVNARPNSWVPAISDVTGLTAALSDKASFIALNNLDNQVQGILNDATLVHTVSGTIPLGLIPTMPTSQITGLSTIISGNQLTSTTNAVNRIAALEGQMAGLGGEGGIGGGTGTTTTFYTSSNTEQAVTNLTDVNLHSPWGIDSDGTVTGVVGTWYYLYTGVRSTDAAYPFISRNGHLSLYKWDENGPADPVYALQSSVDSINIALAGKASTVALNTKADASALNTLSGTVSDLQSQMDTKANDADLDNLTTTVAGKATIASLNITNQQVALRATQVDFVAARDRVTAVETALTHKAPLDNNNLVPLTSLPIIPSSQVSGLTTGVSQATLQNSFYTSSMVKRADYVATTPLSSTSGSAPNGLQSVDGVIPPVGAIVLATAQSSSISRGLWVVSSGTWTRPADFTTGAFLARDTLTIVTNKSVGQPGVTNNYTLWQMTQASPTVGIIGSDPNSWTMIAYCAPGSLPIAGSGVTLTGQTISVTPAAVNSSTGNAGGIQVTSAGVDINTSVVARKYQTTITPSTPVVAVTHNLNTWYPQVSIWDDNAKVLVLAGVLSTGLNTISIEFASASGRYTIVCIG